MVGPCNAQRQISGRPMKQSAVEDGHGAIETCVIPWFRPTALKPAEDETLRFLFPDLWKFWTTGGFAGVGLANRARPCTRSPQFAWLAAGPRSCDARCQNDCGIL